MDEAADAEPSAPQDVARRLVSAEAALLRGRPRATVPWPVAAPLVERPDAALLVERPDAVAPSPALAWQPPEPQPGLPQGALERPEVGQATAPPWEPGTALARQLKPALPVQPPERSPPLHRSRRRSIARGPRR